jgi:hypothetical protein
MASFNTFGRFGEGVSEAVIVRKTEPVAIGKPRARRSCPAMPMKD